MRRLLLFLLLPVCLWLSCRQNEHSITPDEASAVKKGVLELARLSSDNVTKKGPNAWLDYFEDSPDFFMVNDGVLAFKDYQSASSAVKTTVAKQYLSVHLKWSGIRIDPLTPQVAVMGANFHEDIVLASGKTMSATGYFTAAVHKTENGWKFRDVHWSSAVPNN